MLPNESTFKTLARALAPLELQGVLRYLPKFEDCGSCAWARIADEDWGDFRGIAMFNEQTKEQAQHTGELYLAVAGFEDEDDEPMLELVEDALRAGGFKEIPKDRQKWPDYFEFNGFFRSRDSLIIWGFFSGKARPHRSVRAAQKQQG